jgi:hypothetical protein
VNLEGVLSAPTAVTLLYATSPILHPVTARLKAIGGRTIGNVFCLVYIILFGYAFLSGYHFIYAILIPVAWAIALSSQFAMQFIAFSSFFLSILYLNPMPIIVIAFAVLSGSLIPRLGVRTLLRRKCDHYIWYIRNYNKGTTASDRNKIRDIIRLPLYLIRDQKQFLNLCFLKITPIIAAYSLPPLVLFAVWIVSSPQSILLFAGNQILLFLSLLSIATLLVFFLTSLRPFLFLGQAERYFEYSAGFIYLLFVYYIWKLGMSTNIILWVSSFQVTAILINFIYSQLPTIKKKLTLKESSNFHALIDYLKGRNGLRMLSIPTKWNFKIAFYLADSDVVFYFDNISRKDKIDGIKYMEEDHVSLSFVKPDMQYFSRKYGINTVVVDKNALPSAEEFGIHYVFKNEDKLFENEDYIVYKVGSEC